MSDFLIEWAWIWLVTVVYDGKSYEVQSQLAWKEKAHCQGHLDMNFDRAIEYAIGKNKYPDAVNKELIFCKVKLPPPKT